MAAVKMTHNVKLSIRSRIEQKYNELIEKQHAQIKNQQHVELFYRMIVDEETEKLANQLPRTMVTHGDTIRFKYKNRTYEIPLGRKRPISDEYSNPYMARSELPCALPVQLQTLFDGVHAEHSRLNEERDVLLAEVTRIMDSCRTLKQLLEVWPSALEFCDSEIQARHARPETKRFKKEDVELADDAKLALVKMRMT